MMGVVEKFEELSRAADKAVGFILAFIIGAMVMGECYHDFRRKEVELKKAMGTYTFADRLLGVLMHPWFFGGIWLGTVVVLGLHYMGLLPVLG